MLKHIFFYAFIFIAVAVHADDKIKMKTGSYMNGEVVRVTEKGILFKMSGMEKLLEFSWDILDGDCKKELIEKYGVSKDEPMVQKPAEKEPEKPAEQKIPTGNFNGVIEKDVQEVNYKNIANTLYNAYMSNVKSLLNDAIGGIDYKVVDGLVIKTKDGKIYRGEIDNENETEFKLKLNDMPFVLKKSEIETAKKAVIKSKVGKVDYSSLKSYVETTLHTNCLKLAAAEEGLTPEQAKYVWQMRLTGGEMPTDKGEKKFPGHKSNRSIDLGECSHYFSETKGSLLLTKMPEQTEWNDLQITQKENVLLSTLISKNFPKSDFTERSCPACKGEGVFKPQEYEKGSKGKSTNKDGKQQVSQPEKPKQGGDAAKPKTCTYCQGKKNVFTFKFE